MMVVMSVRSVVYLLDTIGRHFPSRMDGKTGQLPPRQLILLHTGHGVPHTVIPVSLSTVSQRGSAMALACIQSQHSSPLQHHFPCSLKGKLRQNQNFTSYSLRGAESNGRGPRS